MKKLSCSIFLVFFVFGIVLLSGCMVGPKYSKPETAADTNDGFFNAGTHKQNVTDFNEVDRWWERFGDETTAELVRQALENNNDLKAAAARVLQAQAVFKENAGRRWPDVSYALNRDRSKRSFNFSGARFSSLSTTFSHDISVVYILDFFGKLKRAQRAAWADMLAA